MKLLYSINRKGFCKKFVNDVLKGKVSPSREAYTFSRGCSPRRIQTDLNYGLRTGYCREDTFLYYSAEFRPPESPYIVLSELNVIMDGGFTSSSLFPFGFSSPAVACLLFLFDGEQKKGFDVEIVFG